MKLMVMGHGRHGKDTACEILRDRFGLDFISSSFAAAETVVYPVVKDMLGYQTVEECYNDRSNHRALWFQLIKAYNHLDGARLARAIYSRVDVYCGIRNRVEFQAIKAARLFDYAIWVDASDRLPPESTESCTVTRDDADYVLDNNGAADELPLMVEQMVFDLYYKNRDAGKALTGMKTKARRFW